MKVLMVTGRGVLDVRELPMPEPGPYDALCRTTFGAICAGTDTHVIDGTFGPDRYPAIIGHETIGEVIVVGSAAAAAPGDLVTRVAVPPSPNGTSSLGAGWPAAAVARDQGAGARWTCGVELASCTRNQVICTRRPPARQMPIFITWRETYRLHATARCRSRLPGPHLRLGRERGRDRRHGAPPRCSRSCTGGVAQDCLRRAVPVRRWPSATRKRRRWGIWSTSGVPASTSRVDATGIRHSLDRLLPAIANDGIVGVYGLDDAGKYAIDLDSCTCSGFLDPGYEEAEAHDAIEQAIDDGLLDAGIWIDEDSTFAGTIRDAYGAARDRSLIKPSSI